MSAHTATTEARYMQMIKDIIDEAARTGDVNTASQQIFVLQQHLAKQYRFDTIGASFTSHQDQYGRGDDIQEEPVEQYWQDEIEFYKGMPLSHEELGSGSRKSLVLQSHKST